MFRIFSSIRQGLVNEGKTSKYFRYALGEVALIVVGILMALQISEWNQGRKDRAEEIRILLRLKQDFESNQERVLDIKRSYENVAETMTKFDEIIKPNPDSFPQEQISTYMIRLTASQPFLPITGEVRSLQSSAKIGLISNPDLSRALNGWTQKIESIESIYSLMYASRDRFPPNWHYYKTENTEQSTDQEDTGVNEFPLDIHKILSSPVVKSSVSAKLYWANLLVTNFERMHALQQEILDLIEAGLEGT